MVKESEVKLLRRPQQAKMVVMMYIALKGFAREILLKSDTRTINDTDALYHLKPLLFLLLLVFPRPCIQKSLGPFFSFFLSLQTAWRRKATDRKECWLCCQELPQSRSAKLRLLAAMSLMCCSYSSSPVCSYRFILRLMCLLQTHTIRSLRRTETQARR